ncbi:site-specific integrase [Paenarthrobacter sp. MSM-2-10-13]|uniref:tyrosine-type recombinase/integrase n=2 Tax=Micrococcales TaxID=85006 RepID=UPI00141D8676|nr:site-specific integrase [Paenarthrobacter sp. MSM-2-10-13]QOT19920.1 site-specific integrase [Paenarthrobacter sp. YJN-5]
MGSQPSFMVRWRDPETRRQQGLTFRSEEEALALMRSLNDHGQSLIRALRAKQRRTITGPWVSEVVQEHIDLLVRPSSGTIRTYQRMLDLHIQGTIGRIPVKELGYRDVMLWLRTLSNKGMAPKTIHNIHGLLSAALQTAEKLQYIPRNPCRGVRLPPLERSDDTKKFLTHAEYQLVLSSMDEDYKPFISFLVMTGTRFGEATALTVGDIDLIARPPTARVNKAWKRDDQSRYYLGPTKTGAGKRTIALNRALTDLLTPLVANRPGSDLLFTTRTGDRIAHKPFWDHHWRPAVRSAQADGLTQTPRIHDLRHTHASWLLQEGSIPIFTLSRRLGHSSTRTTEEIYGHLMPQALLDAAEATERSIRQLHAS